MSLKKNQDSKNTSLLDQWKKRKKSSLITSLSPRPASEKAIPSKGQKRLWLLQELYPENSFYQYGHLYTINGLLDIDLLNRSFDLLFQRHEILRTNFVKEEAGLFLKINPFTPFISQAFDLSQLSSIEQEKETALFIEQESNKPFDLATDLLLRVSVLKLSESTFQVILSMHHIIGDRWSLRLLNEELFDYYKALKSQSPISPIPLKIQYADFAYWQKNQVTNTKDLTYWLNQLSGELPLLNLPEDFKRPQKPSFKGQVISKKLSPELSAKLQQMAKQEGATMYVLMLSAFKTLLYRYTNQTDFIIGSPFSNRDKTELEKLIGFFNETLVLRSQLEGNWTFKKLVAEVKASTLKAFEHKDVSFDELVRVLKPERHGSANPVFQAMFLYNSILPFSIPDLELDIQEKAIDLGVSKFDLTLFVNDLKTQLEFSLEFALDLFKQETAERMLQHLEVILQSVVKDIDIPLSKISILGQEEKQLILQEWNDTTIPYPAYSSIHQMIEEQAQLNPDQIAVVFQNDSLSYAKFNQQAEAIAAHLIESGVQTNDSIGLYSNRSVDLIIGMLGILKAGAAYLPLDPEYPAERIEFMIEDSGTTLILSQKSLIEQLDSNKAVVLSIKDSIQEGLLMEWEKPRESPDQLAYIIYTSGSTGKPKGVPIRHKNLLHSTLSRYTFYPSNPEAFLLLSSFSFDSSIVGIFWTLCSGGTLVLSPKRIEQDVIQLCELIARHQVTHTLMLPSLYSVILNHAPTEQIHTLKNVMVAGEACPFSLIDKHYNRLPDTELYNEYGPTEASVWCIAHQMMPDEKDFVPIGKAIPNTEAYILNSELQANPIGVPGELYIGGLGLAEGYLNRPDLTADRFLDHPFKAGQKVYRTGDLARFHVDGRIEFLGRVDQQVKVRGFRVEPEEIQKKILAYTEVKEALVIVHQSKKENQKRLIAYVSGLAEAQVSSLRQYLSDQLPAYMVPAEIIPLEVFPRLPNGKINRKGLADPATFNAKASLDFIEPKSSLQIQLAKIWEEVLNLERVGLTDNFFALGGDSILSIQVISKARNLGIIIAPTLLFEHQTIEALSRKIKEEEILVSKPKASIQPLKNPKSYPLSFLQKAFLFNSESEKTDQGLLQLEFSISGEIDFSIFKGAWQQSMERHDAMRAFIAYEETSQAIQIIAPAAQLEWQYLDWKGKSKEEQSIALSQLRQVDQEKGIDLKTAPASRMYFVQLEAEKQLLFWTCHHIFLDGWSCGIILKDALNFYQSVQKEKTINLSPIPNFLAYLDWQEQSNRATEIQFWAKTLAGFKKPLLFQSTNKEVQSFKDESLKLSQSESIALERFCQQNSLSTSTLFQGLWAVLLGQYFGCEEIVYGLTVSGRFANFPQIELTSGLFMNVIPNRFIINKEQEFGAWLKDIQKKQGQISQYENTSLEEIKAAINWPNHLALFDALFVYGNFLKDGLKIGDLEVEDFQGGFTSSYPLTIRVNPLRQIELDWRYDSSKIDATQIISIKHTFHELIKVAVNHDVPLSIQDTLDQLAVKPSFSLAHDIILEQKSSSEYIPPRNQTELDLCNIWERIFNRNNIGVVDNFFELGGQSLMAIQLFSEIEKDLNHILPPALLFQKPTIAELAESIKNNDSETEEDQILIPLQPQGQKPPLFCIHGGGAHVFFYKKMATYFPEDLPVYSFQPPGLNGHSDFPNTIEAMATQYIETLKSIQAEGPYHLLGTCFSNSVVLEMAHQLQGRGDEVGKIFIIDSAPVHLFGNDLDGKSKTLSRFFDLLKRRDISRIQHKIKRRFQRKNQQQDTLLEEEESNSKKQLRITIDLLNKLYADYHWKAFEGSIYFIRSKEFHERADKAYHLTQWNKLAKGGVNLEVVPGHHLTLFEDPEVKGLAERIVQCIESENG